MEHEQGRELDEDAEGFIIIAYRLGISVILIHNFLLESKYNSTITKIHETLWGVNIIPDNHNCSYDSLIWRRYLAYNLESHNVSTLEQFEHLALQETIDYFNIDKTIFTQYWNDYNKFMQEIKSPLDPDWIFHGFHYFGFTFRSFANLLFKKGVLTTSDEIYQIYLSKTENYDYTSKDLTLCPKIYSVGKGDDDLRMFWKFSYKIGHDLNTIIEWTEVLTGTSVSLAAIENNINRCVKWGKK